MRLSGTVILGAPREKVFSALVDPAVLQQCIEGCEKIVPTGPDSYEAHLKIGIAMFKGSYTGQIRISEKKSPESLALAVEGKGGPGFIKGAAKVTLSEREGSTELRYDADAQVGGLIAAVGSRFIESAARKMADDFFRKLGERFKAG